MKLLKILAIVLPSLYIIIKFIVMRFRNTKIIRGIFDSQVSIAVVGPRRMGKDTLMSFVSSYDKIHNSNIALHPYTNVCSLESIMVKGITRQSLVKGVKLNVDRKKYAFLDNNTYISDAGIYFPNYEDEELKKEYPYFPAQLAIWGHLFEGCIHFNTQRNSKLWLQIREHINSVIECRGCNWLPFYCLIKVRYFESVKDYEDGKTPLIVPMFSGAKGEVIVERASRGFIKDYWLLMPRKRIQHDTHIFRHVVFKEEEEDGKTKKTIN